MDGLPEGLGCLAVKFTFDLSSIYLLQDAPDKLTAHQDLASHAGSGVTGWISGITLKGFTNPPAYLCWPLESITMKWVWTGYTSTKMFLTV